MSSVRDRIGHHHAYEVVRDMMLGESSHMITVAILHRSTSIWLLILMSWQEAPIGDADFSEIERHQAVARTISEKWATLSNVPLPHLG